ncbi:tyrosinase family protein [Mariniflexile litorale]|uniref:Tyrosinase family protein n=1 Tax=Mariniflexile litorale TaxID=3045158 RepID=A0AAU7EG80_9FLAO|nr:tyrosinase family protein [Mariniflexile sp. KMM 9835]MDQ8212268.1 tyrosinase family protein [Mariniflexile sp. KMM 9835]
MTIEIRINDISRNKRNTDYIGWSPRPAWIRQVNGNSDIFIDLKNNGLLGGGEITFFPVDTNDLPDMLSPSDELTGINLVNAPQDEGWVKFYVAGKFDQNTGDSFPSSKDKDTGIGVYNSQNGNLIYTKELMVRVRKNVKNLSLDERRDFLEAIMFLNTRTSSNHPWKNFQDMHVGNTGNEIHGRSCFLPWHRMYLLNLERLIQNVEITQSNGSIKSYAHVTIPYWDFFDVASNVFVRSFAGNPDSAGLIDFNANNPLVNWSTNLTGIIQGNIILGPKLYRAQLIGNNSQLPWDPQSQVSPVYTHPSTSWAHRTERETIYQYSDYYHFNNGPGNGVPGLEQSPHGGAHVSWGGPISLIGFSPADPVFFMLHCNVDRLWATWQWKTAGYRFDPTDSDSYDRQGTGSRTGQQISDLIGNYTEDTLWPWDGDDQHPRPPQANWGNFPDSNVASAPGPIPKLKQAIDYHGQHSQDPDDCLGFDYDDIPLDYPTGVIV